tara:strand:- start:973 stop:1734 length:762 start_codon:yes stop_codon:yes gene_type:complete
MAYRPEEATPDPANHVKGFPESYFERLKIALGLVKPRCHALDLGTGRGEVARGLVRHGATVTAIDNDMALLEVARGINIAESARIDYLEANAEATGLDDASLDLVVAGKTWHVFDAKAVAAEAHRLLRMSGHLLIAEYAWQPLPRNVVEATEELIAEIDADWPDGGTNGLYGTWHPAVRAAGFIEHQTFLHDVDVEFTHAQWRAYVSRRAAERMTTSDIERLDDRVVEMLEKGFAGDYLVAPHRAFTYIAQKN